MADYITRFEVALEILGQSKAPFVNGIHIEKQKEKPNQVKIQFLKERERAINNLMDELMPNDIELVEEILCGDNKQLFRG
jgi:hypothetical protein